MCSEICTQIDTHILSCTLKIFEYSIPYNNRNIPIRHPAHFRRINKLMAKRTMSISQALRHPYADQFMAAFANEISLLKDMKTFVAYKGNPKDIPKGSLLSSKAIFTMVYNPDGTFKKFKACLVARGDMLKNILDSDTYAGTVRADTLRLLLSIAAEHDLDLVSHDIKTAFLYSDVKPNEDIYLRRPNGVTDDIMPAIVQLKKCLHGLPQASKYFDDHFLTIGFTRCVSDAEVFILSRGGEHVILSKRRYPRI